jgi:hypothetical protein
VASPVGAAITKAKVKKIAAKEALKVAGPLAGRFAYAREDADALVGTSGTVLSTSIIAPTAGHLAITAGADVWNDFANDVVRCLIDVDGTNLGSSDRQIALDGAGTTNQDEDCSTQAAVAVGPGTHSIGFEAADVDSASTHFDEAVLWAIFVPYDANGALPAAPSLG